MPEPGISESIGSVVAEQPTLVITSERGAIKYRKTIRVPPAVHIALGACEVDFGRRDEARRY